MKYLLMTDLSIYPTTPATVRTAAAEHGEAFPPCVPVPAHNYYHIDVSTY